jgi:hypothetical protein
MLIWINTDALSINIWAVRRNQNLFPLLSCAAAGADAAPGAGQKQIIYAARN